MVDARGAIPRELSVDGGHPTPAFYRRWSSAVLPVVRETLRRRSDPTSRPAGRGYRGGGWI